MKIGVFNSKKYDREFLLKANQRFEHEIVFFESRLTKETVKLAEGYPAISVFVNDKLDKETLEKLSSSGTKIVALRCAGFNNVAVDIAAKLGIKVVRVPSYSPHAVAEHTIALILSLNRKIHKAYNRVHEGNFSLDGLLGFDLVKRTVGIIGTGKIGVIVARILCGFGCNVLAYDVKSSDECLNLGVKYVSLEELISSSDIITLHCPLNPKTHHIINRSSLDRAKDGVMIINTGRGALIDSVAAIDALKRGKIAYLGLDVYEEEEGIFFEDLSSNIIQDDIFVRLLTFPNVLITSHQGFFTREAMTNIAHTTLQNISDYEKGIVCTNEVREDLY